MSSREIGFGPGFIEKNQMFRVPQILRLPPFVTPDFNIGTILLGRDQDFFLNVSFSLCSARQSVARASVVPRDCRNSDRVRSGCSFNAFSI